MPLDLNHPRGPRTIGDGPGYRTPEHEEKKREVKVLMGLRANSQLDHVEEEKQKIAIRIRTKEMNDKEVKTLVPTPQMRQAKWEELTGVPLVQKKFPSYTRDMDSHAMIE